MNQNKADILLGLQWGDEGKGKLVDVLTPGYDIIARFQGGPNAGHTLEFEGHKHVLHTIPSGIFRSNVVNLIGNGVVIDPVVFEKEIDALRAKSVPVEKRLLISRKAHIILPTHRMLDRASEASKGDAKIGSTLKGIGPAYMDKTGRNGMRVGDLLDAGFLNKYGALKQKHLFLLEGFKGFFQVDEAELKSLEEEFMRGVDLLRSLQIVDSEWYINQAIQEGKKVLAEGAQGSLLDIDFGSYPFVTSSNTVAAGACTGLGIAPGKVGEVIGIFKAYCTRVGSGPFPTELIDTVGEQMRKIGNEFGSTTGRPRRCGWLDLPALRYACMINGVTQLIMMKADVLSDFNALKICTSYKTSEGEINYLPYDMAPEKVQPVYTEIKGWTQDLTGIRSETDMPIELKDYISFIESDLGIPVTIVSVGPDRDQTILRERVMA
ncbi:MAG: adenylosuccinate synthase [Flavobacteriales bacterium]|nr:adenylosuccinate synthase [Flavobacteriales bacterium]